MNFLAALSPLLTGSKSVTITLTREQTGALAALIVSTLGTFDPDTTDPAVSTLQAALAKPLRIVLPAQDPDAVFAAALTEYAGARTGALSDLQAHLDALAQAQQAAKDAAAKAQADARAKAKKPKAETAAAAASPPHDEDDAEAEEEGASTAELPPAATATPPSAAGVPAAASTLNLFG